jgi:Lon protease-like protein
MEIPHEAPVMTLPGVTLLPEALLPLHIFELRYRRMLASVLRSHRMFVMAMQKPGSAKPAPSAVACLGLVSVCVAHADGTSHLILQGLTRVELTKTIRQKPFPVCQIKPLRAPATDSVTVDALMARLRDLVTERIQLSMAAGSPAAKKANAKFKASKSLLTVPVIMGCLEKLTNPDQVADLVSSTMLSRPAQKQIILETVEIEPRLKHLIHFLMDENMRRQTKSGTNE